MLSSKCLAQALEQPEIAKLAVANIALQRQLTALQGKYETLHQDLEAVKQRLAAMEPPTFGSMPMSAHDGLSTSLPLLGNGHAAAPLLSFNPQGLPGEQHQFGAFASPFPAQVRHASDEGLVIVGGHNGDWLSTCCTYFPGLPSPAALSLGAAEAS